MVTMAKLLRKLGFRKYSAFALVYMGSGALLLLVGGLLVRIAVDLGPEPILNKRLSDSGYGLDLSLIWIPAGYFPHVAILLLLLSCPLFFGAVLFFRRANDV